MDYAIKSRHGVYQARFQLPAHIKAKYPNIQKEYVRSLGTKNRRQARHILAIITNNFHTALHLIECNMPNLTPEEIEEIVKKAISLAKTLDEQSIAATGFDTINFHRADPHFDLAGMLDFIEGLDGREARVIVERYFDNQKLLSTEIEDRLKSSTDDAMKEMGYVLPNKAPVLEIVNHSSPRNPAEQKVVTCERISFKQVADEYKKTVLPKIKNPQTNLEKKGIIDKVIVICPDKPIADYTGRDTRDFLEYIDNMPTDLKVNEINGKSLIDIINLRVSTRGKRLSERQQNKYFSEFSSIIKYASRNDYIPAAERILKDHVVCPTDNIEEPTVDFTVDDLNKIFSGRYYTAYPKRIVRLRDYMHWLPLLGLFTGARLEELCQLHLSDIREEQGILYIDINEDTPDKKIKNDGASKRVIPVHSKLLEFGFQNFLKARRSGANAHMVFHTLKRSGVNKWHQRPGANHRTYLKSLKIETEKFVSKLLIERKHFHSYRHAFKTRLTGEFMRRNEALLHVDLIVGHALEGAVKARYNHTEKVLLVPALKESIEKLPFSDIEFSYVQNHWE